MNNSTSRYYEESMAALRLPRVALPATKPRQVIRGSIRTLLMHRNKELISACLSYFKILFFNRKSLQELNKLRGEGGGRTAIVLGNGPSQGYLTPEVLSDYKNCGGDVFAVNFWSDNARLSVVVPTDLVISDPYTLSPQSYSSLLAKKSARLKDYIYNSPDLNIWCPVEWVEQVRGMFNRENVYGFVDVQMRLSSSNIDLRFPRGYLSMTLYKSLAIAIFKGYSRIHVLGMDNTYPRDVYCDSSNSILNLERHAGDDDWIIDQTALIPSMDVWAQDIFDLFYDLRKCFAGANIINLDPCSLVDVFEKCDSVDNISSVLLGSNC